MSLIIARHKESSCRRLDSVWRGCDCVGWCSLLMHWLSHDTVDTIVLTMVSAESDRRLHQKIVRSILEFSLVACKKVISLTVANKY